MSKPTIEQLAAEMNAQLESKVRDNGESFACLKDGRPDWMEEAAHAAHGDMLPDDWRYEFIEDALTQMENGDTDPDDISQRYCRTHQQTGWLHSRNDRHDYCDEVRENYGEWTSGIMALIAAGMQAEYEETFRLLYEFLENRVSDIEAAEDLEEPMDLEDRLEKLL